MVSGAAASVAVGRDGSGHNAPIAAAIRAIPSAWFKPDPRVYWADMLASASIGWAAFALGVAAGPGLRAVLLIVAAFLLYRAALFIHELTHLAAHELPAFRLAWNALIGVPLLLPSFLYEGVHTDHHRQRTYGTVGDPEYVPFGRRPPLLIAGFGVGCLLLPAALAIRFGIVAPLSWAVPALRRITADRFSALALNSRYVRHAPIDRAGRIEEACATAVVWSVAGLWIAGVAPTSVLISWVVVSAIASTINGVHTLCAHLYDRDGGELTMVEQLLDSCTIAPRRGIAGALAAFWHAMWAPVGLRFHALHHWIPSLPYHNLGRAHRLLVSTLAADAPYGATQYPAIAPVIVDLIQRSARQSPRDLRGTSQ